MEVLEGKRFAILSIMFWRFGAKLVMASRLPVSFQAGNGKEQMENVTGFTVHHDDSFLFAATRNQE